MIVVHHLDRSRSQRILWLLEELGLPYEVVHHKRHPTMAAPDAMKAIHPLGKAPIIEDDGRAIAETGAIVEHLVEKAGGLLGAPIDPEGAANYRYFMHYAEGSIAPAIITKLILLRSAPDAAPGYQGAIDRHMDVVEDHLTRNLWFAGAGFSAADVMMSFPLEFGAALVGGSDGRPKISAFLQAIHARPAYLKALEVGGPYDYAQVS